MVFDGYSANSTITKCVERETFFIPIPLWSNRKLAIHLNSENISISIAVADADFQIVSTAIIISGKNKPVLVVGQDVDLLVLLSALFSDDRDIISPKEAIATANVPSSSNMAGTIFKSRPMGLEENQQHTVIYLYNRRARRPGFNLFINNLQLQKSEWGGVSSDESNEDPSSSDNEEVMENKDDENGTAPDPASNQFEFSWYDYSGNHKTFRFTGNEGIQVD
ncbi:hypothetical protein JTB14_018090 [Gonioctena quinquepunctata]|nr:hypothetical protein JTB14_018090 [Gonioctena quinquepunctata]